MRIVAGDITDALSHALALRIGKKRHELWFVGNTRLSWRDGELVVGVPNLFYHDWLQKSYAADLAAVASEVLGHEVPVRFSIDPELFQATRKRQSHVPMPLFERGPTPSDPEPHGAAVHAAVGSDPRAAQRRGAQRPRRFRRLDDFVVGPCNRVAHAAATSLAEAPGESPSPLVLYGPVGTGKTHLLEGAYSRLRELQPGWRLLFVSAEDFTNRFVHAMHQGKLNAFRKQMRECDALFLDDVHFLARKPATQEEFLHTLDALQAEEKAVALTCDCHPRLADHFQAELSDRLVGGAVWGVAFPDRDTRLALARSKSRMLGDRHVPEEVLAYLADQLQGNVRELEGALHSVHHLARVHDRAIDLSLVREATADVKRHSVRVLQLSNVEAAVCSVLGLEPKALQSRKRGHRVSHPRMLAMYLARKHTAATYTEIGQRFGGLNHSTAVAGEKKVRRWLEDNAALNLGRPTPVRDLVEKIERELLC